MLLNRSVKITLLLSMMVNIPAVTCAKEATYAEGPRPAGTQRLGWPALASTEERPCEFCLFNSSAWTP